MARSPRIIAQRGEMEQMGIPVSPVGSAILSMQNRTSSPFFGRGARGSKCFALCFPVVVPEESMEACCSNSKPERASAPSDESSNYLETALRFLGTLLPSRDCTAKNPVSRPAGGKWERDLVRTRSTNCFCAALRAKRVSLRHRKGLRATFVKEPAFRRCITPRQWFARLTALSSAAKSSW